MQLSLNSWPALASHLACVFFGLFLSHLDDEVPKEKKWPLISGESLIAIEAKWLHPKELTLKQNDHLNLIKLRKDEPPCRIDPYRHEVSFFASGPYLKISSKGLVGVSELFLSRSTQRLAELSFVQGLPYCREEGRVHYGS